MMKQVWRLLAMKPLLYICLGCGMGWIAAVCALRPEVERVQVVERDRDVLAMHRELQLYNALPGGVGAKVELIEGDALSWRSDAKVDLLMPDIWLPLVSDGRVNEVRQMQANIGAQTVYFWGQELEIARYARAAGRTVDAAGIAATVRDFGLPLVGPDRDDYPLIVETAAQAWMRDRWIDGAPAELAGDVQMA